MARVSHPLGVVLLRVFIAPVCRGNEGFWGECGPSTPMHCLLIARL